MFWVQCYSHFRCADHFIPALATEPHILHLTLGTGEAERVLVPRLSLGTRELGSDEGSVMVQALSIPKLVMS